MARRIVFFCDWLPPDFGAVGQYAMASAQALAADGAEVMLVGFTTGAGGDTVTELPRGRLVVRRVRRRAYDRSAWMRRAVWTLGANVALLRVAARELRACDEIRFTGSPPYMLHFVMPAARLLGKRTRYRITDFHPECLIAALGREPPWARALRAVTEFWRRRVDVIEVLGEDQRRRIRACGVPDERIVLVRDPSPVRFEASTRAASPPPALRGRSIVLYSGNWGVAHDVDTFVEGFARFCARHPDTAGAWLNSTGKRADQVEQALVARGLPHARTQPVPLAELPGVLRAAAVHVITLSDAFVGYVLPSKVYACVASGRPVLFVGSAESDVHLVCASGLAPDRYRRVDVGDAAGVADALERLLVTEATAAATA
ncbi:MAG TPA: glycosyltransferase [Casimicrobiaceae bacterium]|nr:glycosyltransferase [Casimicrobiaceae bacterium]